MANTEFKGFSSNLSMNILWNAKIYKRNQLLSKINYFILGIRLYIVDLRYGSLT